MGKKNISIYGVHIPRKCTESIWIFTHAPVPQLKLQVEFFQNLFPPKTEGLEQAMIYSIKIKSENMKMTWNISLSTFCVICNFSKCDSSTVL